MRKTIVALAVAACVFSLFSLFPCSGFALAKPALARPAATPTPEPLTQKIREKQTLIEATRRKLEESRKKLHSARFKVQTISEQLDATNGSIARVSGSLALLATGIERTQARLTIKRRQLDAASASLGRHRSALEGRLVDIYEYGPATYLDVLMQASSFTEFLTRWDFLRALLRSDAALIAKINVEQAQFEKAVAELEATQNDLESQRSDQQSKRAELATLAEQRQRLLSIAQRQKNVIAQEVVELEELTAAQEAALQRLIVEKQRQDQERVRQAKLAAWQARRAAAIAAGLPPPPEPDLGVTQFSWPVRGPITSGYGMRRHPVLGGIRMHNGIDIGASYGAPIEAAAEGVVIYSGWYGGYGNTVIIDHGGGVSTLYAHCSALYVHGNQEIQRGQVVGLVGATGYATGPHLHFEIRVNGVPVDPLTRL